MCLCLLVKCFQSDASTIELLNNIVLHLHPTQISITEQFLSDHTTKGNILRILQMYLLLKVFATHLVSHIIQLYDKLLPNLLVQHQHKFKCNKGSPTPEYLILKYLFKMNLISQTMVEFAITSPMSPIPRECLAQSITEYSIFVESKAFESTTLKSNQVKRKLIKPILLFKNHTAVLGTLFDIFLMVQLAVSEGNDTMFTSNVASHFNTLLDKLTKQLKQIVDDSTFKDTSIQHKQAIGYLLTHYILFKMNYQLTNTANIPPSYIDALFKYYQSTTSPMSKKSMYIDIHSMKVFMETIIILLVTGNIRPNDTKYIISFLQNNYEFKWNDSSQSVRMLFKNKSTTFTNYESAHFLLLIQAMLQASILSISTITTSLSQPTAFPKSFRQAALVCKERLRVHNANVVDESPYTPMHNYPTNDSKVSINACKFKIDWIHVND